MDKVLQIVQDSRETLKILGSLKVFLEAYILNRLRHDLSQSCGQGNLTVNKTLGQVRTICAPWRLNWIKFGNGPISSKIASKQLPSRLSLKVYH